MDFKPLSKDEQQRLRTALLSNAEDDKVLLMDRKNTSFVGVANDVTDDEVISAIKSVPCHY